jgi:Calx-beta domain
MKKTPSTKKLVRLAAALTVALSFHTAQAQNLVFTEDFETDHSLDGTYVTNVVGGANLANLFFDYSTAGIPAAPNSSGGSTHGLKMNANLDSTVQVFPSGVSVSPIGFSITENFEMRFDMWMNFNGPMPGGGSGSTQVGGAGYGTAGTSAQVAGVADSVFIGATVDGGSGADYRVYAPEHAGSYQDANHVIADDPSSPLVYFCGSRNNSGGGNYYVTNFPGQPAPAAQLALYPQQTGTAANGTLSFKWHDVVLQKVANSISYLIDGVLIATADVTDAGTLGGANILFNHYDINTGASTDPNRTNLCFTLIDNVRITEYTNVVSVTATEPNASEAGPTPGTFTITRTAAGSPVTIFYTLSGSASNGVDYVTLPGSVTFLANDTSTNITVMPIDDSVPELTESVILYIKPSADYVGAGSATVKIADNETPTLTITNISAQMYERTNDFAAFQITRLGDLNPSFSVNLSYSGTAGNGTDFYPDATVSFVGGDQYITNKIYPIADSLYEGNETATVSVAAAGSGEYNIGSPTSASITIVDANGPPENVLFADNFDTDTSANWTTLSVASNGVPDPAPAIFAFDYSSQNIPPAPHGSGDTLGLFVTVNKGGGASAAGVNLYPNGKSFGGDFALRFDMYLNWISGSTATEYALFGVNHSGTKTNWFDNQSGGVPGSDYDGLFCAIEADGGGFGAGNIALGGDYALYSSPTTAGNVPTNLVGVVGTTSTVLKDVFKSPPYGIGGVASSRVADLGYATWADVELSQISGTVTLRVNNTTILSYKNATAYKSGNIMIGYQDPYDSTGSSQSYAIFDNLRVISLAPPVITGIKIVGANVQIDFTASVGDSTAQFALQSAPAVTGPGTDVSSVITSPSSGNFSATTAYDASSTTTYYRVVRTY